MRGRSRDAVQVRQPLSLRERKSAELRGTDKYFDKI